jgi:phenylacetate-CoA ligase
MGRHTGIWQVARAVLTHGGSTRDALSAFQDRAVGRLVAHAAARVPFYRRHLEHARVTPGEIASAGDLVRLPVVAKDDLRAAPECGLVDETLDPVKLLSVTTSGSTGRPFKIVNS